MAFGPCGPCPARPAAAYARESTSPTLSATTCNRLSLPLKRVRLAQMNLAACRGRLSEEAGLGRGPPPFEVKNTLDTSRETLKQPGGADVYQHPHTNGRVRTRREGSRAWHRLGQADRRKSH